MLAMARLFWLRWKWLSQETVQQGSKASAVLPKSSHLYLIPTDSQTPVLLVVLDRFLQITRRRGFEGWLPGNTCNSWGSAGSRTLPLAEHCHSHMTLGGTARMKTGLFGLFCVPLPPACPSTVPASLALLLLKQEPSPCSSHVPAPSR